MSKLRTVMPTNGRAICLGLAIAAILAILTTACAQGSPGRGEWWMLGHDAQHTNRSSAIGPAAPSEDWFCQPDVSVPQTLPPAFGADGTIYQGGGYYGSLFAINPDGTQRWKFQTGNTTMGDLSSPAIGTDGTIYATYYNYGDRSCKLLAIRPDGKEAWEYADVWGSTTIGPDGTIYVGSAQQKLLAINPDGSKKWDCPTPGGSPRAPALAANGTIYAACDDKVYAINPNGTAKWESPVDGSHPNTAVAPDGTIYVLPDYSTLVAIDPENGSQKWTWSGSAAQGMAIGADGTVYVSSYYDGLYAVDPNGSLKWKYEADCSYAAAPVIDANGTVYVTDENTTVHAINPDGSVKWTYGSEYSVGSFLVLGPDGTLYTICGSSLHAIGPGGTAVPPLVSIGEPSVDAVRTGPLTYTVNFTNATDVTLSASDVVLNTTGTANATVNVTGEGTASRTVTLTDITGIGTLSISIAAGSASNANGRALFTGPGKAVDVDNTVCGRGDWFMEGHDLKRTGRSSFVGPTVPVLKWKLQLDDGWITSCVINSEGTLFTATRHRLCAVNPNGTLWQESQPLRDGTTPAIGPDGAVYMGWADCRFGALSPRGYLLWYLDSDYCRDPAIAADGTIYVSGFDKTLTALTPDGDVKWQFPCTGWVTASPALGDDGTIYFGCGDGSVYAVSPEGAMKWQYSMTDGAVAFPAIGSDCTIYMGTYDGSLYAISSAGALEWSISLGGYVGPAALGPDGTVYVGSTDGNLYAVDPQGNKLWQFSTGQAIWGGPCIGADGIIYVGSEDNKLYAVSPAGAKLWEYATGNAVYCTPTIGSGGTLYLSSSDGALYAIEQGAPTVVIGAPSAASTDGDPVSYQVTYSERSDVTLTDADVQLHKTGTADGVVSVTGSGGTRTVTISNATGVGTLAISIAAGTASNEAGSGPAAGPSQGFSVNNPPPSVAISGPSVTSTKTGPVTYAVQYTNAASTSLSAADITLNRTGTASGTVSVSGTGTTSPTVTVSNITGVGSLGISVAARTASGSGGDAPACGPSDVCMVVKSKPSLSVSAPSASAASRGPVSYTVTYAGAGAISLSPSLVKLNRHGSANGVVSVTGSGLTTRAVTVSNITGEGSLGISIGSGSASNVVGSASSASGASFDVINTLPTLKIGSPSKKSTTSGPVAYTVTYSNAATIGLSAADVHLIKTGTANGVVSVSGTGTKSRTVTISGITGDGTLSISIGAGTAYNVAGPCPAAYPAAAFTVVNTVPSLEIRYPSTNSTKNGPVSFVVAYANAASISLSGKVHLLRTGSAIGSISMSGSGLASRTVTISSIRGDGTLAISIDAKSASNIAGSAPAAGPSTAVVINSRL